MTSAGREMLRALLVAIGAWAAVLLGPPSVGAPSAGAAEVVDPVESGAKALRSSGPYPWYDAKADELRTVAVRDSQAEARHRDSQWFSQEWNWPNWNLSGLGDVLIFLIYTVVALVLTGLLALIIRFLARQRYRAHVPEGELEEEQQVRGDVDRIEALPYPILRQRGDLLEAARLAYEAGQYDDAIVCLFSYLLVQLDRAQLVHLARGKTNRQYLREVGSRSQAGRILEPTMVAFEDVFFGRYPLSRERFERCWQRLDEFHALVREHSS